jgi:hypothetical protein
VLEIAEDHDSSVDNARLKAMACAAASGKTCLAMDAGLHLPDPVWAVAPGTRVRRIPGSTGRPSDDEVLEHGRCLVELDHPNRARIGADLALREFVDAEMGTKGPID